MKSNRPVAWILVGCLTLLTASTARAQTSSETATTSPPPDTRRWYGWQTLVVDGAALLLIGGGSAYMASRADANDDTGAVVGFGAAGVGVATFALGGPIVHWAHGNVGKGFVSLGLNVGMTLGLGAVGAVACGPDCFGADAGTGGAYGLLIGGSIGIVAAQIIDVGVLTYEPVAVDHGASRETEPALSLMPDVVITRDRTAWVGLRGLF